MSRTLLHAVPHDKVADEDQHRFAVLVQRRPHLDQPLVRSRLRRPHLEPCARDAQRIPGRGMFGIRVKRSHKDASRAWARTRLTITPTTERLTRPANAA